MNAPICSRNYCQDVSKIGDNLYDDRMQTNRSFDNWNSSVFRSNGYFIYYNLNGFDVLTISCQKMGLNLVQQLNGT